MTNTLKSFSIVWMLVFLICVVALILAIAAHCPYLTLILPFLTTSFVKAFNLI